MLENAFEALARGDAAAALSAARSAVAAEPRRAEAHQALSLALQLSGQPRDAAKAMEEAIKLSPERSELHLARARMAVAAGDSEGADAALGEAVEQDPNSLAAYLMSLHLALSRSQPDEAEKQLKLAQRVAPEHPQVDAAAGSLALVRNDFDTAVTLLTRAARELPDDIMVVSALGLAHRAAGNHAFAEAALSKAVARQPEAAALRWALIDCLRKQGREAEAEQPLRELLALDAGHKPALALLGDVLMHQRKVEPAMDAYRQLLLAPPFTLAAVDRLLQRLLQVGLRDRATALLDELLVAYPQEDVLWLRQLQAAQGDQQAMLAVFDRWQASRPEHPLLIATRADFEDWRGNHAEAEKFARQTLDMAENALSAEAIVLRAEIQREPAKALERIERLLGGEPDTKWFRALSFWRAQAYDALGDATQAINTWDSAWAFTEGGFDLIEIPTEEEVGTSAAGEEEDDDAIQPTFLYAPPGARPREVLAMLVDRSDCRILDDRFGKVARADGLGPSLPDGSFADRAGWQSLVEEAGVDPSRCVDWLPHWDRRYARAMPAARLIAVIADPRDLLMNWMAFASPFPLRFPGARPAAQWLIQLLEPLAQRIESNDAKLIVIRDTDLVDAPDQVAQTLQDALQLAERPSSEVAAAARRGAGGLPTVFAPGHWRKYSDVLGESFDTLAPLAQRMGYPAS